MPAQASGRERRGPNAVAARCNAIVRLHGSWRRDAVNTFGRAGGLDADRSAVAQAQPDASDRS
jgi:hypothetical protein